MNLRTFILPIFLIFGLAFQVNAQQKFGHLNSGILISQVLETTTAEKELEAYMKSLTEATDNMQKAFDAKAQNFQKEYESLPPKTAQDKYAALEAEQQGILQKRQEDQQKVIEKRDLLMKPVFDRVQKAIDEVGKENGYSFIFDTDTSIFTAILFVEESDDVMALVKAKLGL